MWRLGASGWSVRYEPTVTVTHPSRAFGGADGAAPAACRDGMARRPRQAQQATRPRAGAAGRVGVERAGLGARRPRLPQDRPRRRRDHGRAARAEAARARPSRGGGGAPRRSRPPLRRTRGGRRDPPPVVAPSSASSRPCCRGAHGAVSRLRSPSHRCSSGASAGLRSTRCAGRRRASPTTSPTARACGSVAPASAASTSASSPISRSGLGRQRHSEV